MQKGDKVIRISSEWKPTQDHVMQHFDTYFDAVQPVEIGGLLVADFSTPSVHRHRFNGMEFEFSDLPEEMETLAAYQSRLPEKRALAFDVGAYCGVSTYELARKFDRVIAFEPDLNNLGSLCLNLIRHDLSNTWVLPFAMTAESGIANFYAEGSMASRLALPEYRRGLIIPVRTISLRDACERFGVPDYIKMDIEGAEVEVLSAARDLLTREAITFAIDTAHDKEHGYTFGPVESILRSCGYQKETTTPDGNYLTWGWK